MTTLAADIISVHERDAAFAGSDRVHVRRVVALRLALEVRDNALHPFLGLFGTFMLDDGGEERHVVEVGR